MIAKVHGAARQQSGKGRLKPVRIPKGGTSVLKRAGQISFGFGGKVRQYGKVKQVKPSKPVRF